MSDVLQYESYVTPNVTGSQMSHWLFPLSLSLPLSARLWVIISHAQMLSLRPQCLAEISDFSEHWKVPTTGTSVFLSLQSTCGQSFAFPDKSELRKALLHSRSGCLQIETLSSAASLPVTLNTEYDKRLLILY